MPNPSSEKPFIIVAEDDRFYVSVFRTKLAKEGFEVTIAEDGNAAMKAVRARRPDLLLLDLIMPNKDGFEVLKELRADSKLKDLKVIVSTNLNQDEDRKRVMSLGALDYVVKTNVSINEMVERIKQHLR